MQARRIDWLTGLYNRSGAISFALALRIVGDREDAADIIQDSFILALQRRDSYDPRRGSETGWILAIVRGKALDRLRSRQIRLRPAGAAAEEQEQPDCMGARNLGHGLAALPRQQRAALLLAYFEGLTHAEIASRLSAPLGSVKTWLRSGIAQLALVVNLNN